MNKNVREGEKPKMMSRSKQLARRRFGSDPRVETISYKAGMEEEVALSRLYSRVLTHFFSLFTHGIVMPLGGTSTEAELKGSSNFCATRDTGSTSSSSPSDVEEWSEAKLCGEPSSPLSTCASSSSRGIPCHIRFGRRLSFFNGIDKISFSVTRSSSSLRSEDNSSGLIACSSSTSNPSHPSSPPFIATRCPNQRVLASHAAGCDQMRSLCRK